MISLGDLHEAGILRNLLIRYNENLIYVSIESWCSFCKFFGATRIRSLDGARPTREGSCETVKEDGFQLHLTRVQRRKLKGKGPKDPRYYEGRGRCSQKRS